MDFPCQPDGHRVLGTKTVTRVRRFQEHWKEQYPWVYYDEVLGKMFCRTCREHADVCDPASAYFSGGCSNFQLMSLASHAKSRGHLSAEEVVRMQTYPCGSDWEPKTLMSSQPSSSGIALQMYQRQEIGSPGRVVDSSDVSRSAASAVVSRETEESSAASFNITSSEDRIRLLRMAAEEAWRSVGPGSYNVPFSLDFSTAYQQQEPKSSGMSKSNTTQTLHHAFPTQTRMKPSSKVESVSPQSSNIPVSVPQSSSTTASVSQRLKNVCLNAHAVAKRGLSYQDYQWMLEMDKAKGCDVGESTSAEDCKLLQACISETIAERIVQAVKSSSFLSVFCDEVSGASSRMKVIYVKTVQSGKPLVHVLSVQTLPEDAEGTDFLTKMLSSVFKEELEDVDFDWKEKLIGFSCSDSLPLRTSTTCSADVTDSPVKDEPRDSSKSGHGGGDELAAFIRTNNPQILSLHCSVQTINSTCRHLVVDYHRNFETVLTCFCTVSPNYCQNSAEGSQTKSGNEQFRTCKIQSLIRDNKWITWTLKNAQFVIRHFSHIVQCFEKKQETVTKHLHRRSQQCLNLMLTQRFVKYIHLLVDMLEVLNHVCDVMTQRTASIGEIYEAICDAADNLMKLKKRSGQHLAKVEKELVFCGHTLAADVTQEFENDRLRILTEITEYMTSCVTDLNEDTMTAMTKLVCLSQWPADPEQLKDYAEDDLLLIIDRFSRTFHRHEVDTDKCLMEWSVLKNHIRRRFTNPSVASWEAIYPACRSKCQNVLSVLSFILTLPGQSTDRGRVHSYLEKLPSKWKTNLSANEIKNILRIFLHASEIGGFDPSPAVALYCDKYQSTTDCPIRKKLKTEKTFHWLSEDNDINME